MSYVKLKHSLSAIALDAVEHPDRARVVDLLRAFARRSRGTGRVHRAALARAAAMAPNEVGRLLVGTGLFAEARDADGDWVVLAAPFRPFAAYLRRQSARTAIAVRLVRSPHRLEIPAEIWRGAALFNAGLFFECHEYLEDAWRAAPDAERAFYHGLVQAAAGCYHLEKANVHGARTLIQKAISKLEPYAPAHHEVEVGAFVAGLRRLLTRVGRPAPPGALRRPRVPMLDLVSSPPVGRGRARVDEASEPQAHRPGRRGRAQGTLSPPWNSLPTPPRA